MGLGRPDHVPLLSCLGEQVSALAEVELCAGHQLGHEGVLGVEARSQEDLDAGGVPEVILEVLRRAVGPLGVEALGDPIVQVDHPIQVLHRQLKIKIGVDLGECEVEVAVALQTSGVVEQLTGVYLDGARIEFDLLARVGRH